MKASSSVVVDAAILPTRVNMSESKLKALCDETRPWDASSLTTWRRKSWQEPKERGSHNCKILHPRSKSPFHQSFCWFFLSAAVKMTATQVSLRVTLYANKKVLLQGPKSGIGSVASITRVHLRSFYRLWSETPSNNYQPQQKQNPPAWASPQKYTQYVCVYIYIYIFLVVFKKLIFKLGSSIQINSTS